MNRKEITEKLTIACSHYWSKKNFSVHTEVGVEPWGRRRADLLCLNTKAEIVLVEVKSCRQDYISDNKWKKHYIDKCNKMYFCITEELYESSTGQQIKEDIKAYGIGLMVLRKSSGQITVMQNAKRKPMNGETKKTLVIKMAWKGGVHRGNTQAQRIYLDQDVKTPISESEFLRLPKTARRKYLGDFPTSPFWPLLDAPKPRRKRRFRKRTKRT